jgi:TIR domain
MPDTLVVCFTLNHQSIKGALAVALSVREQRPEMRIFPVAMRIDASEEKLLNRMKSYAASVFTPLLAPGLDDKEYWYAMEVPYFARYAYAEKLALFEERGSITASTLPAMERLTAYLTADEIRTAEPLPETERAWALAEFEGSEEAPPVRPETSGSSGAKWASRWFLSYNSPDRSLAERLSAAIEQEHAGFRVFFSPSSLRAGSNWARQIAAEVSDATAFLLLVGASGIGPWQVMEYYEAVDRRVRDPNFPIVQCLSPARRRQDYLSCGKHIGLSRTIPHPSKASDS